MACALPWHLVKGLSHLTCCTFRCRSVFHFFNRKLFTYFYIIWFSWPVFKTKRIFWKMANRFFRTSIPSSVPLWRRVWKEKCPMPYSLLASHCRQCRDCLRWPRQVWLPGSVVTAPSGEAALLWNLVPPEDRAPSARLRDGWPVWPRTSHCWRMACSCLSWWWALLATARVWPFVSPHCLLVVDWAGFSIPPSSGGRNTWVLSLGKNLGLLVLGKGCEGRRDRCVGLEGASQAWDEFLLLSFLCIGRMNRKTNMSAVQYLY